MDTLLSSRTTPCSNTTRFMSWIEWANGQHVPGGIDRIFRWFLNGNRKFHRNDVQCGHQSKRAEWVSYDSLNWNDIFPYNNLRKPSLHQSSDDLTDCRQSHSLQFVISTRYRELAGKTAQGWWTVSISSIKTPARSTPFFHVYYVIWTSCVYQLTPL